MRIVVEELSRMGRLFDSPYFGWGLALLSALVGMFTAFGVIYQIFIPIFLEIIGWIIGIIVSTAVGFTTHVEKNAGIRKAAIKGAVTMMEANLPREMMLIFSFCMLLLYGIPMGMGPVEVFFGIVSLIWPFVLFFVLINVVAGLFFGAVGGYVGGNRLVKELYTAEQRHTMRKHRKP